jgi:hypothetical protein
MNDDQFPREQDKLYRKIYGGISFSGERPGYICIVGELRQPVSHRFVLLDEAETFDTEQLIAKAGAFDFFYKPERWLSGELDKATRKLLIEFNKQPDDRKGSRKLRIVPSRLKGLDDQLFRYVYPKLKRMTGQEGELDISKGKLLLNYMSLPQDSEIATIKHGEFPSIESLAFAITDLEVSGSAKKHAKCMNDYKRI